MRRAIAISSLCFAWLCANGAIWDAVQVFAWGKMFVGYVQTMGTGAALSQTLDASKPCPICLTVRKAKATEQQQATPQTERSAERIVLACEVPTALVFAKNDSKWPAVRGLAAPSRTERVPVPPPRA